MNRLTRFSATIASSAFLVAGVAGVAAASPDISGNGNNSDNSVTQTADWTTDVDNDADVSVQNNNPQTATSGAAVLDDNRDGGDVTSGDADNTSDTRGTVNVDYSSGTAAALNGGAGGLDLSDVASPSISDNGNSSTNTVTQDATVDTTVTNNSTVSVQNNNTQNATSGTATATNNRDVGNVTSGSVSNSSTTSFTVSVKY